MSFQKPSISNGWTIMRTWGRHLQLISNDTNLWFCGSSGCLFSFETIKISGRDVYIDVEVDENEEASAVCNQKAGRSVSSFFSLFPSWYGNRRMLCIPVRIRLYAAVLYGESHSWIVRSCEAPWAISQTTALWYTCRSGKRFFPGVKPFDTPYSSL